MPLLAGVLQLRKDQRQQGHPCIVKGLGRPMSRQSDGTFDVVLDRTRYRLGVRLKTSPLAKQIPEALRNRTSGRISGVAVFGHVGFGLRLCRARVRSARGVKCVRLRRPGPDGEVLDRGSRDDVTLACEGGVRMDEDGLRGIEKHRFGLIQSELEGSVMDEEQVEVGPIGRPCRSLRCELAKGVTEELDWARDGRRFWQGNSHIWQC